MKPLIVVARSTVHTDQQAFVFEFTTRGMRPSFEYHEFGFGMREGGLRVGRPGVKSMTL